MPHTEAEGNLLQKMHPFSFHAILRQMIEDKEIHPQVVELSVIEFHVGVILRMPAGWQIQHARHEIIERVATLVFIRADELHRLRKLGIRIHLKALELFPAEHKIHVIIPGDEALVPNRPEERA